MIVITSFGSYTGICRMKHRPRYTCTWKLQRCFKNVQLQDSAGDERWPCTTYNPNIERIYENIISNVFTSIQTFK